MVDKPLNIDVAKLQAQVQAEVAAEELYWQKNDAKFRAIEQKVPSYEDFRQMVLASHLKPLDKGETFRDGLKRTSVWNNAVAAGASPGISTKTGNTTRLVNVETNKPTTSREFMQAWQQLEKESGSEAVWSYICQLGRAEIIRLFTIEISGEALSKFLVLFADMVANYQSGNPTDDQHVRVDLLFGLLCDFVKCNRFQLNKMFLKPTEIQACEQVITFLSTRNVEFQIEPTEIDKLRKAYL